MRIDVRMQPEAFGDAKPLQHRIGTLEAQAPEWQAYAPRSVHERIRRHLLGGGTATSISDRASRPPRAEEQ